ncbi:MAG: hypothetical protein HY855_18795 [Burkholderiales bacterium]|nr:hypothetical protein [Burkholderiales bacterium]
MPDTRTAPEWTPPLHRAWALLRLVLATLLLAGLGRGALAGPTATAGAPLAATTPAGVNGLWTSSAGDYSVWLQDPTSGLTLALELPATLDSLRLWLGNGSATQVSLQNVARGTDLLVASVSGSTMSGTRTLAGVQQPYSAQLALAWVATEAAGVWQKSGAANAYLVFFVVNNGGARLGVQIDVTINPDLSYAFDVFSGSYTNNVFNGLSLLGSGLSSRLEFTGDTLAGTYTTLGRPPKVTTFTATHLVKTGP